MIWLRAVGLALGLSLTALPAPVWADAAQTQTEQRERLWAALDLTGALTIMQDEGRSLTRDVEDQYLGGRGGTLWDDAIDSIYSFDAMEQMMRDGMVADLGDTDIAPMIAFFESDVGQLIVSLEMSAREAFLDPDTEEAARDRIRTDALDPSRFALIDEFIAANDLVEFNTQGAMNTNVAFLSGLATSDLFDMGEEDIIAQVWGDAEAGRADTEEWLRAYLSTAYHPLTDDQIRAYIDFSHTEPGQRLNRALFAGFGDMYTNQYYALGLAVAEQMSGQDL